MLTQNTWSRPEMLDVVSLLRGRYAVFSMDDPMWWNKVEKNMRSCYDATWRESLWNIPMYVIGAVRVVQNHGAPLLLLFVRDGVRYGVIEFAHDHPYPMEIASASDTYVVARAALSRNAAQQLETAWSVLWSSVDLVCAAGTYYVTLCDTPRTLRCSPYNVCIPPLAVIPGATCSRYASIYLAFLRRVHDANGNVSCCEVAGIPLLNP